MLVMAGPTCERQGPRYARAVFGLIRLPAAGPSLSVKASRSRGRTDTRRIALLYDPRDTMAEYGYTELDVQYSPRFWVPRMHEKVVVEKHIEITTAESERVRASVPHRCLRYGEGPRETMDEFGGDSLPNDAPIFVYIHGGYWQHLNKDMSCYPVLPLFKAGIRVVVVGYDLAPDADMQRIVQEAKRAGSHIMQLAEELGSSGVWFSGYSAGGHLTGILYASGWMDSLPPRQLQLVRGFLPISGIFDLKPIVHTYINGPLQMNEAEAEKHSPMNMKIRDYNNIRIIAIFGQHDSPSFRAQSKDFIDKLCKENIEASWLEVPEMDHFNLVENLCNPEYTLTRKLISIIQNSKLNQE
ncbi:Kynurenine formamidase [Frankliniella fusca]|uniref:Kynurenine formamidase n=1 Tax=Frankliniella fusca TaxID=407009 RepID=A0AAE1LE36_9NEOP|nr:Kynurenine formamidase [Frankliniella fusca]